MTKSTLSFKKILLTTVLFLLIPVLFYPLNLLLKNDTITYTVLINVIGCIMFLYNFELIALHYNRAKKDIKDFLLFFVVGLMYFTLLLLINHFLLKGKIITVDPITAKGYYAAIPLMLLSHSFIIILEMNLCYKVLTDRLNIRGMEVAAILTTGICFGLLLTVLFVPYDPLTWIRSWVFFSLVMSFQSYSYNQSTSLLPGTLSLSIVLFVYNLLMIL